MKQEMVEILIDDGRSPPLTGWIYTDATRQIDCSRCGETASHVCRSPTGRACRKPHRERTTALIQQFGTAPFRFNAGVIQ
jgi:hypothetical protein